MVSFGDAMVLDLVAYFPDSAPAWIRGTVVAAYQWAITIGLLLAAIVNNATEGRSDSGSWRIPTGVQFAWGIVLALGMFFLPESPRFLIMRGRDEEAARALGRLTGLPYDDPAVARELSGVKENLMAERALGELSYMDCFKSGDNRMAFRTLTGIFLQAWQQLTGINFIFYYGTTFFQNSGIKDAFLISGKLTHYIRICAGLMCHPCSGHQRCQRGHDCTGHVGHRALRPSLPPYMGCRAHVRL
jgi:SP family sugar:H+ symporter-like MFS transporter